jgi:hypothetical protein
MLMPLDEFLLNYFGKEKCNSFAKFCSEKGLSGQDLYEAAKSTKWKIAQGTITVEGATAYMWKILWNKFRAQLGGTAYIAPEEPKDIKINWEKAKEALAEEPRNENNWQSLLDDDGKFFQIEPTKKSSRAPLFYPKINRPKKPEEPPKPPKKRRFDFSQEG